MYEGLAGTNLLDEELELELFDDSLAAPANDSRSRRHNTSVNPLGLHLPVLPTLCLLVTP
jgi:hypothetical protein